LDVVAHIAKLVLNSKNSGVKDARLVIKMVREILLKPSVR